MSSRRNRNEEVTVLESFPDDGTTPPESRSGSTGSSRSTHTLPNGVRPLGPPGQASETGAESRRLRREVLVLVSPWASEDVCHPQEVYPYTTGCRSRVLC